MSASETPRERALRLWEAAGYARAAAYYDAYDAVDAVDAALDDDDAIAAYEAGYARYKKEHP